MFYKKLFQLPSPKEMGADHNSLPLRQFTPEETSVCWEDYFEKVKEKYPIRYFFAKSLPEFIKYKLWFPIKVPLSRIYDYFLYNFHPKHKYHLLDLRQPQYLSFKDIDYYQYGWREIPDKMLYAMFNLAIEYIKSNPYDVSKDFSMEEINNDIGMKTQHETYQTILELVHWWQIERKYTLKNREKLFDYLCKLRKNKIQNKIEIDCINKTIDSNDLELKNKTEEYLIKLIKIRENLWI